MKCCPRFFGMPETGACARVGKGPAAERRGLGGRGRGRVQARTSVFARALYNSKYTGQHSILAGLVYVQVAEGQYVGVLHTFTRGDASVTAKASKCRSTQRHGSCNDCANLPPSRPPLVGHRHVVPGLIESSPA